jgi:hypothetical protein
MCHTDPKCQGGMVLWEISAGVFGDKCRSLVDSVIKTRHEAGCSLSHTKRTFLFGSSCKTGSEGIWDRETTTASRNEGGNGRFTFSAEEKDPISIVGFMLFISTSRRVFFTLTTTPPVEHNITRGLAWKLLVPCAASVKSKPRPQKKLQPTWILPPLSCFAREKTGMVSAAFRIVFGGLKFFMTVFTCSQLFGDFFAKGKLLNRQIRGRNLE